MPDPAIRLPGRQSGLKNAETHNIMDPDEIIRLELPASHKYLNIVGASLIALLERIGDFSDQTRVIHDIHLAVHETCANIVDHAYDEQHKGRIQVTLMVAEQPRRLVIDLQDTGRSFDPSTVKGPDLDQAQEQGYGLLLIHELMDEVIYRSESDGNRWQLVKSL